MHTVEPSKTDTIGTKEFVLYSKVSLAQGLVVDHTPPTIVANHDKARLSRIRAYLGKIATAGHCYLLI